MRQYVRNPNKAEVLEKQKENIERVGKCHEMGCKVPEIQRYCSDLSGSSIEHYVTVYKLLKRADGIVSINCMNMLRESGLRFCNCASNLAKLEDDEFVRVLEYCADCSILNVEGLSRDKLTKYVRDVIENRKYDKIIRSDLHERLRDVIARKFLYDKEVPASTEVVLEKHYKSVFDTENVSGLRIDCLGLDSKGMLHGIEVKTNIQDFENGIENVLSYAKYVNYMYLLTSDFEVKTKAIKYFEGTSIGVLYYDLIEQKINPVMSTLAKKKEIEVSKEKIDEIKFRLYKKEVDLIMSSF